MANLTSVQTARFNLGKLLTLFAIVAVIAGVLKHADWEPGLFLVCMANLLIAVCAEAKGKTVLSWTSLLTGCLFWSVMLETSRHIAPPDGSPDLPWFTLVPAALMQFVVAIAWLFAASSAHQK